jgi:8-oxo-dGTP pyrophosphatase MutT (NUDIX family)
MPLPERLSRTVVYENRWVGLFRDRVRTSSGRVLEEMHVVHVEDPGVAAIVEDAQGRVAMVRVPRYATGTCEWELPEGRAAPGEAPEAAAAREVLEETGWTSAGHERLLTFHPLPGLSSHVMHVVRCRAVAPAGDFDRDEVDEVRWFPLAELASMIRARTIPDGFTLLALHTHLLDRAP